MVSIGLRFLRTLRLCALTVLCGAVLAACGSVSESGALSTTAAGEPSPPSTGSTPQISGTPASSVVAGQTYSFTPTASGADGATLTFSIDNKPSWANFDASSGALTGAPTTDSIGMFSNIAISVSDGTSTASLAPFSIEVAAPLAISGTPPIAVAVGSVYTFQPSTNAAQGTTLTFSISNKPSWAAFSATTGQLSGTPSQAGTSGDIVISVSDGTQTSSLAAFAIVASEPNPTNHPPTISGSPPTTVAVGQTYSFTPTASDPDGDKLSFSIANRPSWATFNNATGALIGTPGSSNVGTFSNIVISVSDGTTTAQLPGFSIQVTSSLKISGTPATSIVAGSAYSFQPTTNAAAGTTLTFSGQNIPTWATLNSTTGLLSGTPSTSQTGTFSSILITVSDGTQSSTLPSFSIKVIAQLTISGTPAAQVTAGSSYSFKPSTSAASGTALTFTVQNKPVWGSFRHRPEHSRAHQARARLAPIRTSSSASAMAASRAHCRPSRSRWLRRQS